MNTVVLSTEVLETISEYSQRMTRHVSIVLNIGEHQKRQELYNFLDTVSGVSQKISLKEKILLILRGAL